MVPTVSLTKARMSTSMSCLNISPRGRQGWEEYVSPLPFPHAGSKSSEGDWVRRSLDLASGGGLPGRCEAFVEVQGSRGKKGQVGAEEGNPCRTPGKACVCWEQWCFQEKNTKVLIYRDLSASLSQGLSVGSTFLPSHPALLHHSSPRLGGVFQSKMKIIREKHRLQRKRSQL